VNDIDLVKAGFGAVIVGAGVALVLFFWNTSVSPTLRSSLAGAPK
jgi:hypothetical protein